MSVATYQVVPPEAFNFSHSTEWTKWIRRFERFRAASELEEKGEEVQVNTLIYTLGEKADDIFQSFGLTDEQKKKYKTVKKKFDFHFVKHTNVIYERARFNQAINKKAQRSTLLLPHCSRYRSTASMEPLPRN